MSETAAQVNEKTRSRRQLAAKEQPGLVDLEELRKKSAELDKWVDERVDEVAALALEVKGLNQQRIAIFDEVESKGLDRKAFKDAVKLKEMDIDKRSKYLMTMRRMARQFGFADGEQLDLLDPILKPEPQQELKVTSEPGGTMSGSTQMSDEERNKAIADHIAKHGTQEIPGKLN